MQITFLRKPNAQKLHRIEIDDTTRAPSLFLKFDDATQTYIWSDTFDDSLNILDDSGSTGPELNLIRRDSTVGGSAVIGCVNWRGDEDGPTEGIVGQICVEADGIWTSSSSPTKMLFGTTVGGSKVSTEVMRLDSTGKLTIQEINELGGTGILAIHTTGSGTLDLGTDGLIVLFSTTDGRSMHPNTDAFDTLGRQGASDNRFSSAYILGGVSTAVETVTAATFTLTATDHLILADCTSNNVDVTLPAASSAIVGKQYELKKIDAGGNTAKFSTTGGDLLDGATSLSITSQYNSLTVKSDGSDWWRT